VRQTSEGPERVIVPAASSHPTSDSSSSLDSPTEEKKGVSEPGSQRRGKWTEEEIETVKTTLRMYSSLSMKSVRAYLFSTYAIQMSESVLGRLRKEASATI
jgi:hypothetical protein